MIHKIIKKKEECLKKKSYNFFKSKKFCVLNWISPSNWFDCKFLNEFEKEDFFINFFYLKKKKKKKKKKFVTIH